MDSFFQGQLLRIFQFSAMLVSNKDYSNNRLGVTESELVINSPIFYGGVPRGINVSVLEVRNTKITL